MVTEPTHIDGGVLDLVLTDVLYVVGVRVGSPAVGPRIIVSFLYMLCWSSQFHTWYAGRRFIS